MVFESVTSPEIVFCFFIWVVLLVYSKLTREDLFRGKNKYPVFPIIMGLVFMVFSFTAGDFFHYKALYYENLKSGTPIHLEYVYYWLIQVFPGSYYLWRFLVWGTAFVVYIMICKRQQFPPKYSFGVFTILLLTYFGNLRQTLPYVLMLYAYIILIDRKQKSIWGSLWAILLIISTVFLHKSSFVYIVLFSISIAPLNKRIFLISLFLFPVLRSSLLTIAASFIEIFSGNETSLNVGMRYLESDFRKEYNLNGLIRLFIERVPVIVLLIWSMVKIYFCKINIAYIYKVLFQYSYVLIYISLLFYENETSAFLSQRFWDASLFPIAIFLTYFTYPYRRNNIVKISFGGLICANIYLFLYLLYKSFS